MGLIIQFAIGGIMIGLTVMVHAIALDKIIRVSHVVRIISKKFSRDFWKPFAASFIVVLVFCAHVVQIWMWAVLYLFLQMPEFPDLEKALYFSTVTYSTLGYGDIIIGEGYRMLAAIEGTNGFLLFGWTTAFIFEIISQMYKAEAKKL